MKKILLLLVLVLVVFIAVNRQRLYLWDPIAKITRDGVKVGGAKAMINYSNDLLLFVPADAARQRITLVQHWNRTPATPVAELRCLSGIACLADADQAAATPVIAGSRGQRPAFEGVTMTDRQVEYVDADGSLVQVVLH